MTSTTDRYPAHVAMPQRNGPGGRNAMPERLAQQVLDAAAVLQLRRSEIAAQLANGDACPAEVLAVGAEINPYLWRVGPQWRDLLAIRPVHTVETLRVGLPMNRSFVQDGVDRHVVSVYDYDSMAPEARQILANEEVGNYHFGFAPVQMKIVDRSFVILEGPAVDEERSIMRVNAGPCLEAAWRYWDAVIATTVPAARAEPRLGPLTARQQQIVTLLANDTGDDAIAAALGVSVRTVRSDIAAILDMLGVKSRFAAGVRLQAEASGTR